MFLVIFIGILILNSNSNKNIDAKDDNSYYSIVACDTCDTCDDGDSVNLFNK